MKIVVKIDQSSQYEALTAARKVDFSTMAEMDGLQALTNDKLLDWANDIWQQIEIAVKMTLAHGRDTAKPAIDKACSMLDQARHDLKDGVAELNELLGKRLDAYYSQQISSALKRVDPVVTVGDVNLRLSGATIQQSLKFSGSIKTKLDEICTLLTEGQIAITVNYTSDADDKSSDKKS